MLNSYCGHEMRLNIKGGESMLDTKVIAKKLRELRGERTREEVAVAVHVSASALSMYENGSRIPRDEIKVALARYYNTSVGALFFDQ